MTKALYAEFSVLPGSASAVASLVSALTVAVRAEPGCVAFEPYLTAPLEYFVYEVYRDEAAFLAHTSAPHSLEFNAALAGHVAGGGSRLTWLSAVA